MAWPVILTPPWILQKLRSGHEEVNCSWWRTTLLLFLKAIFATGTQLGSLKAQTTKRWLKGVEIHWAWVGMGVFGNYIPRSHTSERGKQLAPRCIHISHLLKIHRSWKTGTAGKATAPAAFQSMTNNSQMGFSYNNNFSICSNQNDQKSRPKLKTEPKNTRKKGSTSGFGGEHNSSSLFAYPVDGERIAG